MFKPPCPLYPRGRTHLLPKMLLPERYCTIDVCPPQGTRTYTQRQHGHVHNEKPAEVASSRSSPSPSLLSPSSPSWSSPSELRLSAGWETAEKSISVGGRRFQRKEKLRGDLDFSTILTARGAYTVGRLPVASYTHRETHARMHTTQTPIDAKVGMWQRKLQMMSACKQT